MPLVVGSGKINSVNYMYTCFNLIFWGQVLSALRQSQKSISFDVTLWWFVKPSSASRFTLKLLYTPFFRNLFRIKKSSFYRLQLAASNWSCAIKSVSKEKRVSASLFLCCSTHSCTLNGVLQFSKNHFTPVAVNAYYVTASGNKLLTKYLRNETK